MAPSPLPSIANVFIGRRTALSQIAQAFAGAYRLVTLWGPPGIGKTRLALSYGDRHRRRQRVAFVDLTEARTAAHLCRAVREGMQLELAADLEGSALVTAIGSALRRRGSSLLILDNFEQLVRFGGVLRTWLALAPGLRLLVTSRERLGFEEEYCLDLPPLGSRGGRSEAVQLLKARAAAMGHPLAASQVLGALVERLEGVPLAIELAASRLAIWSPQQLLAQLSARAPVWRSTARSGRHETLGDAIGWSWALLSAAERSALAQCAIFRGGFSLEAAEAVIRVPAGVGIPALLESLRAKALLRSAEIDGQKQLGLLLCIREFAEARLQESRGNGAAYARHADYFVARAQRFHLSLRSTGNVEAYRQLARDAENLAVLLSEPGRVRRPAQRAACLAALDPVLLARGARSEQLAWLAATQAPSPFLDACRGELLIRAGKLPEAERLLRRSLAAARRRRDSLLQAEVLGALGRLEAGRGDHDASERVSRQAMQVARKAGHGRPLRVASITVGIRALHEGQLDRAEEIFRTVQQSASDQNDRWTDGIAHGCLADRFREAGSLAQARRHYTQSIQSARAQGDSRNLGVPLVQLAGLEHEAGRWPLALRLYREALAVVGEKQRRYDGLCRAGLAALQADRDLLEEAAEELKPAEAILGEIGSRDLLTIAALARAHLDLGRARASAQDREAERWLKPARALVAGFAARRPLPFHARLLVRALRRTEQQLARAEGRVALRIAADGRRFQVPRATPVSLFRRRALSKLLLALARTRHESPDRALSGRQLLEVGWPGEQPSPQSGAQRVRVAVATLRGLGLQRLLLTRGDGYLLDPRVPFRWDKI